RTGGWKCGDQQVAYAFLGGRTERLLLESTFGGRHSTVFYSVRPDGEEVVSVFFAHWPRPNDARLGLAVHCSSGSRPEFCRRILDSVRH
ncbi:MAG TPA: hypothetical protein VFO11_07920, partial [Candidatus Polarisedimenticolaceae bacterium]|nr:hypothetical protein [Candidatus Polarisedimenticolaceae bacterium]